jgi:ABC-2 type transport system ATP-binding protein
MEIITTEKLEKHYDDTRALRGLNLRVSNGIFGFIGVNGAGKTTTIKILVGALRPNGGKAYVLGYDCVKESLKIRQKIGVLHEKPSFPKNISGIDYLIFVGQLYELPRNEANRQSQSILEELSLSAAAKRPMGSYSAGMRQRLGLAQALVGNPELVILDEPTANLDPIGRRELLEIIRRLQADKGVNFFISSHILPELQTICDHIGVINKGILIEQGTVKEVVQKHAGHIFRIIVSDPKVLLDAFRKSDLVDEFHMVGDTLWVKSRKVTEFHDYVMEVIQRKKLQLSLFQQGDLESAFKNIVERDKE